ncbi:MAG: hypothetical protein AAF409_07000 [Pseudomonadota bacterium]
MREPRKPAKPRAAKTTRSKAATLSKTVKAAKLKATRVTPKVKTAGVTQKVKAAATLRTPKLKIPPLKVPRPRNFKPLEVEVVPEGEDKLIRESVKLTFALQERRKAAQKGEVLRGVHPKSHGCLIARFTVSPKLRKRNRVGIFAVPGRTFKAKIRLSNASTSIAPDMDAGQNGSRGFAMKIMEAGKRALLKDQGAVNQDFLMINTPEFAFANVADYHRAMLALMADPAGIDGAAYFLPAKLLQLGLMDPKGKLLRPRGEEPPELATLRATFQHLATTPLFKDFGPVEMAGTLKSAQVLGKILATTVRNPLEVGYFAASPVRFGPRRIARFSVEPLGGPVPQAPISPQEVEALGPDFLAKAVAETMATGAALTLRFKAQIMHPVELEGRSELIEDATVAWDPEEFQPVELGKITIDPSDQPADLVDACKTDRFSPWHCLPAHEPVGGINRLRKPVYETSANHRG